MKTCIKCSKEINEEMMYCPYCGEKQDSDDFLSNLDSCLTDEIETKITLENEQEKFKLFNYEKVADDTYIIKGLKNKYVYKVDVPEGVVAICEEAFVNSKVIEVNLPNTLMEIEARAFKDCKLLKKINIPETLSVIGDEAFYNCVLLEVNYNNDNITFGNDVFVGTLSEKLKKDELKRKEIERKEAEQNKIAEEKKKILINRKTKFDIEAFINQKYFGRYPQTKVADSKIISILETIEFTNESEYIEYEGNEYKKYDGNYYLVEPIKWRILEKNGNSYKIVSEVLLDLKNFFTNSYDRKVSDRTIRSYDYEYSLIRAWLNGYNGFSYKVDNYEDNGFINIAFNDEERKVIHNSIVENDFKAYGYSVNNCIDKVYLLSSKEYEVYFGSYDFDEKLINTDYTNGKTSKLMGGKYSIRSSLLRTPFVDDKIMVGYYGRLQSNEVNKYGGVQPVIEIKIK